MTRSQRSVSNPPVQQDFGDEDPDHWITKYEQEMSTLQPRETEKIVQNDAIPDVAILPGSFSNREFIAANFYKDSNVRLIFILYTFLIENFFGELFSLL